MLFRHCLLIKCGLMVLLQDLYNKDPARLPFQLVLALFPMGSTTELICCFVLLHFVFILFSTKFWPAKQGKIFCPQKHVLLSSRQSTSKGLGHVDKDIEIGYSSHFLNTVFFQAGCSSKSGVNCWLNCLFSEVLAILVPGICHQFGGNKWTKFSTKK